jgi:hypothetical protein
VSEKAWYPDRLDVYLNLWFADYETARRAREVEGGFLLPYEHHFFICPPGAIRSIGLDPDDPDWEKVGWDCARPKDPEACRRLCEKRDLFEAAGREVVPEPVLSPASGAISERRER